MQILAKEMMFFYNLCSSVSPHSFPYNNICPAGLSSHRTCFIHHRYSVKKLTPNLCCAVKIFHRLIYVKPLLDYYISSTQQNDHPGLWPSILCRVSYTFCGVSSARTYSLVTLNVSIILLMISFSEAPIIFIPCIIPVISFPLYLLLPQKTPVRIKGYTFPL